MNIKCTHCGAEIDPIYMACPECGYPVQDSAGIVQTKAEPPQLLKRRSEPDDYRIHAWILMDLFAGEEFFITVKEAEQVICTLARAIAKAKEIEAK